MMHEQLLVIQQVNEFLERYGMQAKFMAKACGISSKVFYNFKSESALLTKAQLECVRNFMAEYEARFADLQDSLKK